MRENTGSRTATTFTLPAAMHESWSAEDQAELLKPYVWPTVEQAEATIVRMRDINGFDYVQYEAPGLSVFAVTDRYGHVQTIIVIEDDTAARLHRAVRREQPVTVTYVKADGEETVRTIEPTGLSLTKAGDVIVKAADRKSGEKRSFRLDRVRTYTLHRTAFTIRTGAPAPRKADLVAAFRGRPVRWTPNPDRTPSPLTATGWCLNPSGEHGIPAEHSGRCTRCGAVPVYA